MINFIQGLDVPGQIERHLRWVGFALAALLLWPGFAAAELIVFTHGGFLEVKSFELEGEQVRLEVPGGALRVPLISVERILEDEEPTTVPEPKLAVPVFDPYYRAEQPCPEGRFSDLICAAAQRHSLNPALVSAVVRAESAFDPEAVSVKGARGLMQLMPATGRRFGLAVEDAFDPARNLDAGCFYLRWLLDRFDGRVTEALAAYNAGEGAVDRYRGIPPFRETRNYLKRIFKRLKLPAGALEQEES